MSFLKSRIFVGVVYFFIIATQLGISYSIKPNAVAVRKGGSFSTKSLQDTVRILAIRVDFPRDTLATTTGDGGFDYGQREGRKIDPPPHDSIYFQHQFQFLHNYFNEVSNGKLSIIADVYPIGLRNAYRMSEPIWYYHPNPSDSALTNLRITELWKESWERAALDTSIQFIVNGMAKYDVYVVIHAGSGNEYDIGFDETPFDIPSGYITKEDLNYYLNINDPRGLSLRNGEFFISEGPLLPEMSSQKVGNRWIDIGVGGLYAFLIGRSLGLPFMYDVQTGQSRLGRWDFMDRGFGTFFGILPSYPSAYLRIKMGWAEYVVAPDTGVINLRIPNADTIPLPEVYKVEGTGDEYFLLEARNRDPDSLNYTYVYDSNGRRAKLTNRYEIEIPASDADSFGVIVRADNYEFDIPGSGILIWRINSSEEQRRSNLHIPFQSGEKPYVVTLIEADGANDIGQNYGFFHPGSGTETGSPHDAFFQGNPSWRYANQGDNFIRFSPFVIPPAQMSNGAPAPFEIRNFSLPSRVMQCRINRLQRFSGERRLRIPPTVSNKIALPFDANNDSIDELWIVDSTRIYSVSDSGKWLGIQLNVYTRRNQFSNALMDSISSYSVFQLSGNQISYAIFGKDQLQNSFLFTASYDSALNRTTINSLKIAWHQNYFVVDSVYTTYYPNQLISAFAAQNRTGWIVFLDSYEPIELSFQLQSTNLLTPTQRYFPIIRSNGSYVLYPTDDLSNIKAIATSLGDYLYHNQQFFYYDSQQWNLQTFFPTNEPILLFLNTSENLAVLTQNHWWLWGSNSIRSDFPKRLGIDGKPISAAAGFAHHHEPIIWVGTENGELWTIQVGAYDARYPISVGVRQISNVCLLSDSSTSEIKIRLAAVSDDGGIYLIANPLQNLNGITSNCKYGSAFGKPLYSPPKEWINEYQSSVNITAFVWPNPIRSEKAYIRLLANVNLMVETKIEIYDLVGQRITTLSQPYPVEGGGFEFEWSTNKVNRGIYLIRVQCGNYPVQVIKAAVL